MAQGSLPRAACQSNCAASSALPWVMSASLKASSKRARPFDLPAGLPDCPGPHFAVWLPDTPGLVAGHAGFELCILLHNARLLSVACSSVLMGGNGVNHRSPERMVAQVDLEIIWMAQGAPCLSAQPVPGVLPGVCPREHKASVKVCSCLGRPFRLLLCPLLQRGMVRPSAPSWNWLAQSTGDCDSLPACRHRDRAPQTPGSKGVLPGWPNGMNVFGTGLGTLDPGGYPVRSSGDSQPHRRGKFERHPRWPARYQKTPPLVDCVCPPANPGRVARSRACQHHGRCQ